MAIEQKDFDKDTATLYAMGSIYCRGNHKGAQRDEHGVCPDCARIIEYSLYRTSVCPYDHKGNCKDCSVHCYTKDMRAGIKSIMKYGAPRMIYQHPLLTARYVGKKVREHRASKAERAQAPEA